MTAWDFWHAHPFLAWCALWLGWVPLLIVEQLRIVASRWMRTRNIRAAGWPPPHLDADGDWKPAGD